MPGKLKMHKVIGGIRGREIWAACGVVVPERFGTWDDLSVTCKNCLQQTERDAILNQKAPLATEPES